MTSIYYSPLYDIICLLTYSEYGITLYYDNSGARTVITEQFAIQSLIKNEFQLIGAYNEN